MKTEQEIINAYHKQLEKRREYYHKKYSTSQSYRENFHKNAKKYRRLNKEKIRKQKKDWRAKDDGTWKNKVKDWLNAYKSKVIWYYSNGTYQCACCGMRGLQFMSLDHPNNDGREKRIRAQINYTKTFNQYSQVIRDGFKDELDVLCIGCNWMKGKYGVCPHNQKPTQKRKHQPETRKMVLDHYGNKCSCCGETNDDFLSIVGMTNETKVIKKKKTNGIFSFLRSHGYPKGFQTACYTCSWAIGKYGICPHVNV